MTYECPHGNSPGERCARCVAAGQRQPGDHNARRYTNPDRVEKQTKADDDLERRADIQNGRRRDVERARRQARETQEQRLEYDQGG